MEPWVRMVDVSGKLRWQTVRKVEKSRRTWDMMVKKQRCAQTQLLVTFWLRHGVISAPSWLDSTSFRLFFPLATQEWMCYIVSILPQIHLFLLDSNHYLPILWELFNGFLTPPWRCLYLAPPQKKSILLGCNQIVYSLSLFPGRQRYLAISESKLPSIVDINYD